MPNAEKRKELTKQIIIRVKEVIAELSDKEIMDRMEAAGEQTSLATIRRIRAEGSEDAGFNYNLTVRPFAKVFLEISDKPVEVEALSSKEEKDRAALDNMIQLKNFQIEALEAQLEEVKAAEQRKIAHLQGQIEGLNKILEDRKGFMAERRDFILRLEDEKRELRTRYEAELATQKKLNRWVTVAFGFACFLALVLEPLIPLFR